MGQCPESTDFREEFAEFQLILCVYVLYSNALVRIRAGYNTIPILVADLGTQLLREIALQYGPAVLRLCRQWNLPNIIIR